MAPKMKLKMKPMVMKTAAAMNTIKNFTSTASRLKTTGQLAETYSSSNEYKALIHMSNMKNMPGGVDVVNALKASMFGPQASVNCSDDSCCLFNDHHFFCP
jgi:hypothetical protein